jgi:hypothetical protein
MLLSFCSFSKFSLATPLPLLTFVELVSKMLLNICDRIVAWRPWPWPEWVVDLEETLNPRSLQQKLTL